VIVAAPNHWHALATVWACQAGKDVYVEKPVSHTIWEGRQMVAAARKYRRIVQSGTQRRSDAGLQEAIAYIREGHIGKITLARGLCYVRRGSIGKVDGPQTVPASVDYDLWCGPAPKEPLMRRNLHYDWHWVWSTGNGDLGNNGIHFMDVCRWAVGAEKLAPRVLSIGGRFEYVDDGETPNTQIVYLDYSPAPIIYEVRGLAEAAESTVMDHYRGIRIDVVIHCEGGYLAGGWVYDNDGKKIRQFMRNGGGGHHANFIKAVRSRKMTDLNADILEGHLSSGLCHMGNVSHRLGQAANAEEIAESVQQNAHMLDAFERMEAHLAANKVDFGATPRVLGAALEFDADTERFTGACAEAANRLVTRRYRAPFVLPANV
jgi:predicted dehydrogenase